ncbi:MAG: 3-hydroxy acid dehydrogenase/malonic semialdehyde reductase [Francisellaceae bacterium]|jgi:3-hydroxy acid dehydrogenase/malonic semialdehyde reductase
MKSVVLITGSSSGFGEACAKIYNKNGHPLILVARRLEKLEELKKTLSQEFPVHIMKVDVTNVNDISGIINLIPKELRDIGVLINNAGVALGINAFDVSEPADNKSMIDTNINGLINFTREILPVMVKNNNGHVINIGSIAGSWPYPGGNIYCATKAFVQQFSRCLRADLAGKNVRVSNIEPGLAQTGYAEVRFKGDKGKADSLYENTKPLVAADIAEIIYFTTTLPTHVNINSIEVMPTCQTWSSLTISRDVE